MVPVPDPTDQTDQSNPILITMLVVSYTNPLSSDSEIAHQVHISNHSIAFATSWTASKLLLKLRLCVIFVDSPEFDPRRLTGTGKQLGFTAGTEL
ncbi:hypothetical protein CRG98_019544 [Punica granatum]|uniref:Uncharacterized protein n=1 Tax=Punica granatum TaxID=22663 RepID=A0A2I0JUR1_PUNGR|nr:hypothetical protein CRG98_019544 [Punica granatum]